MNAPISKERRSKIMIKAVVIIGFIVYFYGLLVYLHAATIQRNNPRIQLVEAVSYALVKVFTAPTEIFPLSGSTLLNSMLFTIAALMMVAIFVANKSLR